MAGLLTQAGGWEGNVGVSRNSYESSRSRAQAPHDEHNLLIQATADRMNFDSEAVLR